MKTLLVSERSAGHVFPALAFAGSLSRREDAEIYFFTTAGFLKSSIKRQGYKVLGKSFYRRNLIIEGFWRFFEAIYILLKLRPERVIGFGGRDSIFLVLFAHLLRRQTFIYEPNRKLGRANKFLVGFGIKVLYGFKVGVPLRQAIEKIDKSQARKLLNFNHKPIVLCFGGSQGSGFLNQTFFKAIQELDGDFQIIHLTGRDKYWQILKAYAKVERNKFVKDFYQQMAIAYSAADLVVSRAGATTLAELSFFNLPSILIPHPKLGVHQKENSLYFKEKAAAFVHFQEDFQFEEFKSSLKTLIFNTQVRQEMINNLNQIKLGVPFEDFCQSTYF